ncbi:hypothetical protein EYF80_025276 [Liparis tanakae]|uniref:Uncharacterized protein n=1 Tax=Liparis tanakae TaxID=230148 RepID=A0A4Z2HF78_9TELE|nr:hypothetical protein EYF80_025276 [Liparis tanakae]
MMRRRRCRVVMGKGGRTSRSPVPSAPAVVVVVVVIVAAAVIVIAPRRSRVHGLHRDLGCGLGRGVEDLSPGVVLRPELHRGLHGDLGLLGEAVAAVGGRGAAVARGRRAVGGRRGAVGGGGAVGTPVRPVQRSMLRMAGKMSSTMAKLNTTTTAACERHGAHYVGSGTSTSRNKK